METGSRERLIGLVLCLQLVTACTYRRVGETTVTTRSVGFQPVKESCQGDDPSRVGRPGGPSVDVGVWPLGQNEAPAQDAAAVLAQGLAHYNVNFRELESCNTNGKYRSFVVKSNNGKELIARMSLAGVGMWFVSEVMPRNVAVGYTRTGPGLPLDLVIAGFSGLSVTVVEDGQQALLVGTTSPIGGGSSITLPVPSTGSRGRVAIIGSPETGTLIVTRIPNL